MKLHQLLDRPLEIKGRKLTYTPDASNQSGQRKSWIIIAGGKRIGETLTPPNNELDHSQNPVEHPAEIRKLLDTTPDELSHEIKTWQKSINDFNRSANSPNNEAWLTEQGCPDSLLEAVQTTIKKNHPTFMKRQRNKLTLARKLLAWKRLCLR